MKRTLPLLFVAPMLAACVERKPMVMETDISEADRNTLCPTDGIEADGANYPACN